jgi:uncharacterized Fe-S cluster-containing radical SAM superfamily protein
MYCPRFKHFVRFNPNGTVGCCGHMTDSKEFNSYKELESSDWVKKLEYDLERDRWPKECVRCQQTEEVNGTSIRINSIEFDKQQTKKDYLIVGGVLDNICNSACQFCWEGLSTKIGGLRTKTYPIVDNTNRFWDLPTDRIVQLDINGGEPSASKNYKQVLANLPKNVKSVRINTNCSIVIPEIEGLIAQGVDVTVTVSFDGLANVHNYVRWPIEWNKFERNLQVYKSLPINLNLWTTVCSLNVGDFANIIDYKNQMGIDHSWALLTTPKQLDIKYKNWLTVEALEILRSSKNPEVLPLLEKLAVSEDNTDDLKRYIQDQDELRKIKFEDYYQ